MIKRLIHTTIAGIGAAVLLSGGAYAATCSAGDSATATSPALDTSDVTVSFAGFSFDATACSGLWDGNDEMGGGAKGESVLNGGAFAGYPGPDWSFYGSSSGAGGSVVADGGATSGDFTVDFSPDAYSVFSIVLKGGDYFASYLFDLSPLAASIVDGTFDMYATVKLNGAGKEIITTKALSHLSAYTYGDPVDECTDPDGCDGDTSVVPLPAGMPLVLSAIGMLAIVRRRARASA